MIVLSATRHRFPAPELNSAELQFLFYNSFRCVNGFTESSRLVVLAEAPARQFPDSGGSYKVQVLLVFQKTEKTPQKEIDTGLRRLKEMVK